MNIQLEEKTIIKMVEIYCKGNHNHKAICDDCNELLDYSIKRNDNCQFSVNKPACVDCEIHCYNKDMRERIKVVMRYSGPKMLYMHPLLAICHLLRKRNHKNKMK